MTTGFIISRMGGQSRVMKRRATLLTVLCMMACDLEESSLGDLPATDSAAATEEDPTASPVGRSCTLSAVPQTRFLDAEANEACGEGMCLYPVLDAADPEQTCTEDADCDMPASAAEFICNRRRGPRNELRRQRDDRLLTPPTRHFSNERSGPEGSRSGKKRNLKRAHLRPEASRRSPLLPNGEGATQAGGAAGAPQTLKRKCMMSPSLTSYSLPSERSRPFALTAASEPYSMRSAYFMTSARMKPRSKSV